ncbi:hypothetical protein [Synechococcus sp. CC9616]|nr:hypothetical protein [Synechococcus sp. CC9616]
MAEKIIKLITAVDIDQRLFGFLKIVRITNVSNYFNVALIKPSEPQRSR